MTPPKRTRREDYWFPAKTSGWGWGFPSTWQGRVVLVVYLGLAFAGIPFIHASLGGFVYFAYLSVLTVAFIAVCWRKGEPPRWRWGRTDE